MDSTDVIDFIQSLRPQNEDVASEIEVLQSIYGENAIQMWKSSSPSPPPHHSTRYEAVLSLPAPHEEVSIRVLVSLPDNYPASAAPQLQLLSRYIGAFGADSALFGAILRTFISATSGVEWAGEVCVFDGLQNVLERCSVWYNERLSADAIGELQRADDHAAAHQHTQAPERQSQPPPNVDVVAPLPEDIKMFVAEPIADRKSSFVGRACAISSPAQVPIILSHLVSDRRIARAAHPVINAWRCTVGNLVHQDNDDDGETAAGGRIAHLLQILEVENVLVVVTRYFGGIHLGPDRFKHINQAARNALELGGFLEGTPSAKARGRGR
ncbi:hypothetical protein MIND_01196600 [Mycena indigotica]|uniref:RWD domain-containing protein n=1 Tax=Mycena indigotica TaxID=2126181 RepID=A0A8H6VYN7_9AGAR|nr:uncharacterized protein MIND_01196600 [Mycena indigotica]KAF7292974.1 hypothetical protein MIND_01196600 [Mycena indigotica]